MELAGPFGGAYLACFQSHDLPVASFWVEVEAELDDLGKMLKDLTRMLK